MGAWDFLVLSAGKSIPMKFLVKVGFLGFGGGWGEVPILFLVGAGIFLIGAFLGGGGEGGVCVSHNYRALCWRMGCRIDVCVQQESWRGSYNMAQPRKHGDGAQDRLYPN